MYVRVRGCLDCRECVLLCGRVSDCNDCNKVTGLISGGPAQSGTITVQILWIKSAGLRSSLHLTLTALESGFHYVSLFYSFTLCDYDCTLYRARQQLAVYSTTAFKINAINSEILHLNIPVAVDKLTFFLSMNMMVPTALCVYNFRY